MRNGSAIECVGASGLHSYLSVWSNRPKIYGCRSDRRVRVETLYFVAMQPNEFRRHGHAVVDWIADYLENPEQWPVLPGVRPGELRSSLPQSPPVRGESMDAVLDDFRKLIVPATTHWNHPAFMAYFANSSTGAGVLGEALTAALNVNAMLWRTSPAATELELLTLDWLRQMLGLPEKFFGVIGDTASSNTLYALAAAREMHPELRIREDGMSGRADMPRVVVYCSEEAHSSVDKAVMTLGFGLSALRKIPTDDRLRMDAPGKSGRGHNYGSDVSFSHGCLSRYCRGRASPRAPFRGRKCLRTNSWATDSPSCRPTSREWW